MCVFSKVADFFQATLEQIKIRVYVTKAEESTWARLLELFGADTWTVKATLRTLPLIFSRIIKKIMQGHRVFLTYFCKNKPRTALVLLRKLNPAEAGACCGRAISPLKPHAPDELVAF
ncbi:hypothetical protein EFB08_12900 [Rufibacter latericius]|uniref:Uncharacterized protein n=1 Tax=Rufibacter latericius TaxID=2487040 RepID=A0A3M9MJS8_9BACT|nr:hypothetical protein EFB08_12900 [Rufibacter latericius]